MLLKISRWKEDGINLKALTPNSSAKYHADGELG